MTERVVVDVSDLGPGELRGLKVGEQRVLVCNAEGRYYALEDRCPHAAVPLSGGRLRGCLLECPFHGGVIDVRDGSPHALPIRRAVTSYRVHSTEEGLEIEVGA